MARLGKQKASLMLPLAARLLPPACCRLPPACCRLPPAACRLLAAACHLLAAARRLLAAACRLPHAACCLLPTTTCCVLHAVCCMLHARLQLVSLPSTVCTTATIAGSVLLPSTLISKGIHALFQCAGGDRRGACIDEQWPEIELRAVPAQAAATAKFRHDIITDTNNSTSSAGLHGQQPHVLAISLCMAPALGSPFQN